MAGRLARIQRALVEAPAYLLVERLADQLNREYGLSDVELFLVDYRLAALLPLTGTEPLTHPGSPAWRCFDHQSEVLDDGGYLLPVTVRGERLGVLRLRPVATELPHPEAARAELPEVATLLAHELAAARGSTDRYTMAARTRRLTLAAEMQWELLPGRSCLRPAFNLAGQLEPAYSVRGDSFDWADDADRLYLSAINGMGEGVVAATLTTLATNALRNARRSGSPLADQAALADQALYAHYRGAQHVSALLLELELATGRFTAIDAGSPLLLLQRGDQVIRQRLEAQFPLGMFDGTLYQTQESSLRSGDRLFILSDGIHEATARAGALPPKEQPSRYGQTALERFVRRTRALSPLDAVRTLLGDLRAFVGDDLTDDAVAVCLDWTGGRGR